MLPNVHAALLTLGRSPASTDAVMLLADVHRQIADLLRDLPATTVSEVARLGLVGALRLLLDDELGHAFDHIAWNIAPAAERATKALPALTAEVLFYAAREAIRNAARHGREGGLVQPLALAILVAIGEESGALEVVVEDNGTGIDAVRSSDAGGGRGLALHSTMMAVIGGTLVVDSVPNIYTRVTLMLPKSIMLS